MLTEDNTSFLWGYVCTITLLRKYAIQNKAKYILCLHIFLTVQVCFDVSLLVLQVCPKYQRHIADIQSDQHKSGRTIIEF